MVITPSLEEIQTEVYKICKECYESCEDNNSYFIVKGESSYNVRDHILAQLPQDMAHLSLLDTAAYILDINGDTFINIT